MDFSYSSNRLRKSLQDAKSLQRDYGDRAKPLMRRLDVLKQARNLADVPREPPDRCHQLTGNRTGRFAVVIKDNWRLVFRPDHDPIPVKADGGVDLAAVTAICIEEIVDYHGE